MFFDGMGVGADAMTGVDVIEGVTEITMLSMSASFFSLDTPVDGEIVT